MLLLSYWVKLAFQSIPFKIEEEVYHLKSHVIIMYASKSEYI